jgi:hypothetical protein
VNTPNDAYCNPSDGWYDVGVPYWVDIPPCDREERQDQEYRDYYCDSQNDCVYIITNLQYLVLQYEDNDQDDDGVCDDDDLCPDTECTPVDPSTCVPGEWPYVPTTCELNPNHYADMDCDGVWDVGTAGGGHEPSEITASDMGGCSADQILNCKPGKNDGEYKHGLAPGTINVWLSRTGWFSQCIDEEGKSTKEGEEKSLLEDTNLDAESDPIDDDNDGDGIPDEEDTEPDSAPVEPGKQGKGSPDWWCNKHPNKC